MSQSGELSYLPERLQVKHLIIAAIEPLRLNLDIKQIHFSMEVDENLYITSEGKVSVKAYAKKDNVIMEVADTGIGIENKDLDKLFHHGTDYNQVGNSNEKGTGLGLVLCQELTEKQSGKITAESQVGVGSTFAIILCKAEVQSEVDLMA